LSFLDFQTQREFETSTIELLKFAGETTEGVPRHNPTDRAQTQAGARDLINSILFKYVKTSYLNYLLFNCITI